MSESGSAAHATLDGHPLDPALGMMHAAAHEVWSDPDRYGEKPRAVAAYAMSLAVEVQGLREEVARLRSDIRETSGMADDPEGSAASVEDIVRRMARYGRVYLSGSVERVEFTGRSLPDILGVPLEQITEWWADEARKMEAESA